MRVPLAVGAFTPPVFDAQVGRLQRHCAAMGTGRPRLDLSAPDATFLLLRGQWSLDGAAAAAAAAAAVVAAVGGEVEVEVGG